MAEMVASVVHAQVSAGAQVQAGDVLLVVESMKMQIPVTAPVSGTVDAVHVGPGDVIQEGDVLATIEPTGGA